MAAIVARRRLERGVKLNYPEAIALITDAVMEGARDGRSVAELMGLGAQVLSPRPGHGRRRRDDPRRADRGDVSRRHEARHRALPHPRRERDASVVPGEIITAEGDVEMNVGLRRRSRSPSPTRATVRSRSAATTISSRPIRRSTSTGPRRAACGSTSPPARRCASSRVRRRDVTLVPFAGNARGLWLPPGDHGEALMATQALARRLCRHVRADGRRQDPPGRYRRCSSRSRRTSRSTARR